MMPDYLDTICGLGEAMPMMKIETLGLPRFEQLKFTAQLSVVVSRHDDRLAKIPNPFEQLTRFNRGGLVVHQIAENNQTARPIFRDQVKEPLRDRCHLSERNQPARRALAQFIAEMQIRHREPAFTLMEKREAAIEEDFVGDEGLVRSE